MSRHNRTDSFSSFRSRSTALDPKSLMQIKQTVSSFQESVKSIQPRTSNTRHIAEEAGLLLEELSALKTIQQDKGENSKEYKKRFDKFIREWDAKQWEAMVGIARDHRRLLECQEAVNYWISRKGNNNKSLRARQAITTALQQLEGTLEPYDPTQSQTVCSNVLKHHKDIISQAEEFLSKNSSAQRSLDHRHLPSLTRRVAKLYGVSERALRRKYGYFQE